MFNKISVAVAAALVSTSVLALPPMATHDIEFFMSGATAQDNGIARLFADICVPGTLDTYKDFSTTGNGKKHTAFSCTLDRTQVIGGLPGFPNTNPSVLFHKRSDGGSAMGVSPLLDTSAAGEITAMEIWNDVTNATNCTLLASPANNYSCTITNAGDTRLVRSDAGVSDVNPGMFVGENTPAGFDPVGSTSSLEIRPAAALVFGIPVTTNLRDALQRVQGLTVGSDTEANMPSLTKAEVASIMQGRMKNWNQFKVNGVDLRTAVINAGGTAPASTSLVRICRRVNGSGTQAQMNAKFLNYPCTPGQVAPASAGSGLSGPVITLGSGSGDVDTCLGTAFTNNQWAVGIQATEKNANNALNYRFVKIDGVAPTINNAAEGKYFDWVELTYQWRNTTPNALVSGTDKYALINTIATNAATTTIVRDVMNPGFVYTWGQGGYLALASNGNAATFPFVTTNPVMPYTHTIGGGGPDNCRSPVAITNVEMGAP